MVKRFKFLTPELILFFKQYIELDTSLSSGENYPKAIDLVEKEIKKCGFRTEKIRVPEKVVGRKNRVNLVARRFVSEDLQTMLIYNHVDVVVADYKDAFEFSIKGGKAFGRGTSGMKGSTVAV